MSCGNGLLKLVMWIINLIAFVLGVVVTIIGSLTTAITHGYTEFSEVVKEQTDQDLSNYSSVAVATLVFGVFLIFVSFLGCCGTSLENRCMLYTYAGIISTLVLAQLVVGGVALARRDEWKGKIKAAAYRSLKKAEAGNSNLYDSWKLLQEKVRCCGVDSSKDWKKLPDSCCQKYTVGCSEGDTSKPWQDGCYSKVYNKLQPYILAIGVSSLVFCFIQIGVAIFAFLLAKHS